MPERVRSTRLELLMLNRGLFRLLLGCWGGAARGRTREVYPAGAPPSETGSGEGISTVREDVVYEDAELWREEPERMLPVRCWRGAKGYGAEMVRERDVAEPEATRAGGDGA